MVFETTFFFSYFSSTLLAFIMELLRNSIAMQEQMLACKGFLVIGYSLEKVRYEMLFTCLILNLQAMGLASLVAEKLCLQGLIGYVEFPELKQPFVVFTLPLLLYQRKVVKSYGIFNFEHSLCANIFLLQQPLIYLPCLVMVVTFEIPCLAVFQIPCQQSSA